MTGPRKINVTYTEGNNVRLRASETKCFAIARICARLRMSPHIYGLIGRIHIQSTAFIDEVLAPYNLVRGTFDVLTALRRAGAPYSLTPKELTKHLLLSGAGLNSRINKLETLHYIARLPEPTDRCTLRI